jgi:AcrR family transcriptional regulator
MAPQPGAALFELPAPPTESAEAPGPRNRADPHTRADPRTRILDSAAELYYTQGLRQVGMDQLCAAAGVSLKRLYREFPSKDQLIEAYLDRRSRHWLAAARGAATGDTAADRVEALFGWLGHQVAEPDFRGCPFGNAVGELGGGSPGVAAIVHRHKTAWRALLAETVAGHRADLLTDRLYLLAEGLTSAAATAPDPALTTAARAAAADLLRDHAAAATAPRSGRLGRLLRRLRRSSA